MSAQWSELPELIEKVSVLRCEPDDVIVLRVNGPISETHRQQIAESWKHYFAGHPVSFCKILVLDDDIALSILRKETLLA